MLRTAPLLLLAGCPAPEVEDSGDIPRTDFTGVLVDPYDGNGPVEGAWIVVDDGTSVVTTRSGPDGTFSIPALPAEAPLVFSVLAEGRVGLTFLDFHLSDYELPITIAGSTLRDPAEYEFAEFGVEGTLSGVPDGGYALLYGEDAYHDYVMGGEAPVPFEFSAYDADLDGTYRFSAYSIDQDYTTLAVGLAELGVTGDDLTGLDLAMTPAEDLALLAVDLDRPVLDGVEVASIPEDLCIYAASAFPGWDNGVVTGWAETCATEDDGFHVELHYLPSGDDRVAVYVAPDLDVPTYAYAILPVTGGTLSVDLLDSPVVTDHASFGPGATVAWTPVAGARDHVVSVHDDEGSAWLFYAGDSGTAAFPELPDEVPRPTLWGAAEWLVYARSWTDATEGGMDGAFPYLLGASAGGPADW